MRLRVFPFLFLLSLFCLPGRAFGAAFTIQSYLVEISLLDDASFEVTETIDVEFHEPRHGVKRFIPWRYQISAPPEGTEVAERDFSQGGFNQIFLKNIRVEGWPFDESRQGDYILLRIGSANQKIIGAQRYVIKYRVYNAVNFFAGHSELYWNLTGNEWTTSIQKVFFRIDLPKDLPAGFEPKFFVATGEYGSHNSDATAGFVDGKSFRGETTRPFQTGEGVTVGLWLPQGFLEKKPLSLEALASVFYIKKQDVKITALTDGVSDVLESYIIRPVSAGRFRRPFVTDLPEQAPGGVNWLGGVARFSMSGLAASPKANCGGDGYCYQFGQDAVGKDLEITLRYKLYGNLAAADGGQKKYIFSSLNPFGEPIESASLSVFLPEKKDAWGVDFSAGIRGESARPVEARRPYDHVFTVSSGDQPLINGDGLDFQLTAPKRYFGSNFQKDLGLAWSNNKWLLLPVLLFGLLYWLWVKYGRDYDFSPMVHYYPPADLPPSEGGILIDNKLHDRDLLAIIPFLGSGGYLHLREISSEKGLLGLSGNVNFEFTKLKDLPAEAPRYEHTFFNGIFGNGAAIGTKVMLSDLKSRFYVHMEKARVELEDVIEKKSFYEPYTRGGALFMKILGVVIGATGLVFTILSLAGMDNVFHRDLGVGMFLSGVMLFFFGRVMPKFAPIGLEAYQKLYGFRMFVEEAELPRLEAFLKEDPNYFDKTLPYAIVFDRAEKWGKKFQSLAVPQPTWYEGHYTTWNTYYFMNNFSDGMRDIGNTFVERPAPSSGAGSGWSGFGGGGGGGGFSGGGFGGGGGSDW